MYNFVRGTKSEILRKQFLGTQAVFHREVQKCFIRFVIKHRVFANEILQSAESNKNDVRQC